MRPTLLEVYTEMYDLLLLLRSNSLDDTSSYTSTLVSLVCGGFVCLVMPSPASVCLANATVSIVFCVRNLKLSFIRLEIEGG